MAFKRYIYKNGKRLGPYYYENIKGQDGKVKTVYLGTNPHHHPKHRIRKPLFFLILVLVLILILGGSLFFLQNKAYLIKKVRLQQADFDIDQILLKVLIRSGEFIEKQVRVMNIGDEQTGIDVDTANFDIVNIDSRSFILKPGQTKIVNLKFLSFIEERSIEQQPGVYVGKLIAKSEKAAKEIPIVVEIETKNVLFDMNLNPIAIERKVKQGSDITIEVRLFNLESIDSENVKVEYFVKDMDGNTILTEDETVVVKTQASFFKTISIPQNLKSGPYVFAALAKFGTSTGTSSYLFEVVGPETEASFVQFCKNNVLCLGLSLTTILLLFALTAYFYFFIGAYLYEKLTGITFLRKRKEEPIEEVEEKVIEEPGIIDRLKGKIDKWKGQRELQRLAEERKEEIKIVPSNNLKKFYRILNESKDAINKNDASKVDKLYITARDLYVELISREKQEAYGKLMALYKQRNRLEEYRVQQEGLRKKEELKKQKELEKQRIKEERKKIEMKLKRQREFESKRGEKEKLKKRLERERLLKERKKKVKEFFHKIRLYKTPEEKQQIALQKEKEQQEKERRKQEELRKREESKIQRGLEKQRARKERKRREEELRKQKEEERREAVISNKLDEFNRILSDLKQFVEKDIHRAKKLYVKARNLYMEFEAEEKQKVYAELMGLYDKLNHFIKEEEAQRGKPAKEKVQKFLHKIGIYKTPEEKQQIALQKEKEQQEKERKKEEELRKKELEKQRAKEEKQRKLDELKRQKEQEAKSKEEEKQIPEKRSGILERLFGKAKIAEEEKLPEKQKPIGEVEELEEAIRNLSLFKKIEKVDVKEPKKILGLPKEKKTIEKPQKQKKSQKIKPGKILNKE